MLRHDDHTRADVAEPVHHVGGEPRRREALGGAILVAIEDHLHEQHDAHEGQGLKRHARLGLGSGEEDGADDLPACEDHADAA